MLIKEELWANRYFQACGPIQGVSKLSGYRGLLGQSSKPTLGPSDGPGGQTQLATYNAHSRGSE